MCSEATQIHIFDDSEALARGAADEFVRRVESKLESGDRFSVALSGGSTPKRLYALLADPPYRDRVAWEKIHFFWGDERTVPPGHPDSNFGAADEALLSKLEIPPVNVHRIRAEMSDPAEAAAEYEAELRRHFKLGDGAFPSFDLVFLGMGADGHTASLFPGSDALGEERRLVVATWVEKLGTHRVTLTCPVFRKAACILFMVSGADKGETLRYVLEDAAEPPRYPAQLIRPDAGELSWYIDGAAAQALEDLGGR
jgi:6-phosphogluconolactonase